MRFVRQMNKTRIFCFTVVVRGCVLSSAKFRGHKVFCDALMISADSVTLGVTCCVSAMARSCALVRGLGATADVALDYALK